MSASSIFGFFSRIAMLGALIMAVWFLFFKDRPGGNAGSPGEQTATTRSPSANAGQGMTKAADGLDAAAQPVPGNYSSTASGPDKGRDRRASRTLQVIHLHLPDDPTSRALSDSLAEIRMSWPDHLTIATIDVSTKPKTLADWRVSRAPALVFQSEGQRLASMEEVWPKERLAKKIEALIHGLVQADKNWRPDVKGLERR